MLETLISSRIRCSLLEYVLTHSADRFYLRGLAKSLSLPISPLRRELKRLQQAGMLSAVEEGNMVFYTVNASSSAYLELQRASLPAKAPSPAAAVAAAELRAVLQPSPEPRTQNLERLSVWKSPLSSPALIVAAGVGMILILMISGLAYLTIANQRLVSQISNTITARKSEVSAPLPKSTSSGKMHGSRWQIVPGGFGGFSTGKNNETY